VPEDGRNQIFSRQNITIPQKSGTLISHLRMLIQHFLYKHVHGLKNNLKCLKATLKGKRIQEVKHFKLD
jgi:hypothetical protein